MTAAKTNPVTPALAVGCPVCRVQPGQPCRDPLGTITERHPNRHFAWDHAGRPHLSVPGATVDFPDRKSAPMTTATKPTPNVPLPAGAVYGDEWQTGDDPYRIIGGPDRHITDSSLWIWTSAVQHTDGQIHSEIERPSFHIEGVGDELLTSDHARELAAVLLEAAAQLDRWANA